MTTGTVFVIGAGLSGLAAAVNLASAGVRVALYEASPQAGGRCRSYFDPVLNQVIDNGNHFVLSGNWATMNYVRAIGSEGALVKFDETGVAFFDLRDGRRWTVRPNDGPIPLWIFDPNRRVPGTRISDYLSLAKLILAKPGRRVGGVLTDRGALWERFLRPFFIGALNSAPEEASADLAAVIVRETFAKGGRATRVRIAHPTLGAAFVDPALALLARKGAAVRFGARVRRLEHQAERLSGLLVGDSRVDILPRDIVILAVPPWIAGELVPGLLVPTEFRAIVNAHFQAPPPPGTHPMTGVIGGTAEWVFAFSDRISITVSNADRLLDTDREALAQQFWSDVCAAFGLSADLPPFQIVKERRATFAATPEQAKRRAKAETHWPNLFLAGDWTDTGLPATIEGAVRSGNRAAELALRSLAR